MTEPSAERGADQPSQVGRLSTESRAALVRLMGKGFVLKAAKPDLYDRLLVDRALIGTVLADMNLRMDMDDSSAVLRVAVEDGELEADGAAADATDDAEEAPSLIRSKRLTRFQSVVILCLRRHHRDRSQVDRNVQIDRDQLEQMLAPFVKAGPSETREKSRLNAALDMCKDYGIVAAVRGQEDRYEILPTIRIIVNLGMLDKMLEQYKTLAGAGVEL